MNGTRNRSGKAGRTHPLKTDRIEVVKVLIIAVVSFLIGFGLVILFFKPSSSKPEGTPLPNKVAKASSHSAPPKAPESVGDASDRYAPSDPIESRTEPNEPELPDQGTAPPEVPPGRIPAGVSVDGAGFYLKCWDEDARELAGESCDKLPVFEKRFTTRLYVIDKCKKRHTSDQAKGKFSLGVELDFNSNKLSFWNGASSDLENASLVAKCLRTELAGLPIDGFTHKMSKYRIFFTVLFGEEKKNEIAKPSPGKGRLVDVVKDRVRVRKAPVSGDVIGHISSGNKVRLLGKKDGWCHIVTPNNNEGYMTCEALSK